MDQIHTLDATDGRDSKATDDALRLGEVAQSPSTERAVMAVREFLDMDVACATEFVDGQQVFHVVRGDSASFGMQEGGAVPLGLTYCQRVMEGRLPNLIPDVLADDRAASLPVTKAANIGAYVSIPITFSNGEFYGTLCAGSHEAKPELGYRDLQFLHVFARIVADQLERDELRESARSLELQAATARTLIAAVQARDAYTGEHSKAVVEHALSTARHLELTEDEVAEVEQVALLHDIGKIAIPDSVLGKPGPLTDAELAVMRTHPVKSERLIGNVPGLGHLGPAIRAEHERWDGHGYPDGLAGEAIPLASRIAFVCDAYHAMISDRPYRQALSDERAANSGTQFCPTAAKALLETLSSQAPAPAPA